MAASINLVKVGLSKKEGRGLFATCNVETGQTLFEEEPIVCAQYCWNADCKYYACEHCLRNLETAEENVKRLSKDDTISLPYPACCEVDKSKQQMCEMCDARYCSDYCKVQSWNKYHQIICSGQQSSSSSPLNELREFWKTIHYPPETSSITLIVKMIAMVKQCDNKDGLLRLFYTFCNKSTDDNNECVHKLLGDQFSTQIDILSGMLRESIYEEAVSTWYQSDGFRQILAMIGTNGQGIGTSSLSSWVSGVSELDLSEDERMSVDSFIDMIYEKINLADAQYDENGEPIELVHDAFLNCEGSGLYELQSAANHSCQPNAEITFPHNNSTLRFIAVRNIKEGEEIFISYMDDCLINRSRHTRQKYLRENYLFLCDCVKCTEEAEQPDLTSEDDSDLSDNYLEQDSMS